MFESEARYGKGDAVPLRERTRDFALRVIRMYAALPHTTEARVIGKQCLRSGTSVGAHYREGLRGRSEAEVISKLEGALQELEETRYWFKLLIGADILSQEELASLSDEADQLTAILVTCVSRAQK